MSLADSIFIFVLALIIFGPKKLPEMAKQLGRLVGEFRRASNEFKFQIEEELRQSEMQDRQKIATSIPTSAEPSILPPALQASATEPPATSADELAVATTIQTSTAPAIVPAAGSEPRNPFPASTVEVPSTPSSSEVETHRD
ncbi:MAG TPA: twin-arginine translocase TatA/TatE family subunit [Acidobacteriaceae bacterium]|nr:twin-arginine translocase TatA/TatE family subunit [Acidobacteriaceae bacterium]